ncbi:amino acid ABC transporter ATP-binding protein [Bradyrhizobium sp. LTSP885]|uniref:ABC transporter ATP-binding protein n=1 Tax=Bradyrhizobium sp. LTSP885 TaxID=1619232 RepID=UPI0005CA2677|nr:ABC transporter ATP-binding protein [Bradyrhizobium sp. LTSP885]KJC50451.1 amino acid ABC transporter ATP-binding protein [Bradyrhizobium sp. LTSP885]
MSSDHILLATGLSKRFFGFLAVDGVSLNVRKGSIHALIGPNGAGKTTCFNLLTKFLQPDSGSIRFDGVDITKAKPASVARLGMVRSFQISSVFPSLTVAENVRVAAQRRRDRSYGFWRSGATLCQFDDEVDELVDSVGLMEFRDDLASRLSYGRKRALEFATTLALKPSFLLLDEPMAGMSNEDVDRIADLIRKISVDRTILMVEHNLSVVASLSDTITVLARGKVIAEGDYGTVSKNRDVIQAYIGTTDD